eukprot:2592183-Rhodomonas_salina.1
MICHAGCETRGSKVERQTNEESTTANCQSEYQLPISAVSLYDCMPRVETQCVEDRVSMKKLQS